MFFDRCNILYTPLLKSYFYLLNDIVVLDFSTFLQCISLFHKLYTYKYYESLFYI